MEARPLRLEQGRGDLLALTHLGRRADGEGGSNHRDISTSSKTRQVCAEQIRCLTQ